MGGGWSGEEQEGGFTQGHKETLGGDKCVHYLGCGSGFIDVYMCQNLSNCTLKVCAVYCMSIIHL